MKKLVILFFLAFTFLFEGKVSAQKDIDPNEAVGPKVILVMPNITTNQLNGIKSVLLGLNEVTDAAYVGAGNECLILDINVAPTNEIKTYYDIIKRLSKEYNFKDVKIKEPSAFNEIISKITINELNTLK